MKLHTSLFSVGSVKGVGFEPGEARRLSVASALAGAANDAALLML